MASRNLIHQITAVAMIEGFFNMLWDQKYMHSPNNKTFASLHQPLVHATSDALAIMRKESGGLTIREMLKLRHKVERMKTELFGGEVMDAMQVIALSLDLLGTMLVKIRPATPKHQAVNTIWYKIRALERYYDRRKTYDAPDGLHAAEIFNRIMRSDD